MVSSGPAAEEMTPSISVITKSRTMTKIQDVKEPSVIAKIITRGALKLGFGLPRGR
jgi:hypothetical protein